MDVDESAYRRPRIDKKTTADHLETVKQKIKDNVVPYNGGRTVFENEKGNVTDNQVIQEALAQLEDAVDRGEYV